MSTTMTIDSVDATTLALHLAIIGASLGLVRGLLDAFTASSLDVFLVVLLPILFGLFGGLLFGFFVGTVYNLVAEQFDGIEVTVSEA